MAGTVTFIRQSFDIVVIGGSGAALAALEVNRAGAIVGLISKESSLLEGTTIISAGGTSPYPKGSYPCFWGYAI